MAGSIVINLPFHLVTDLRSRSYPLTNHHSSSSTHLIYSLVRPRFSRLLKVTAASSMEIDQGGKSAPVSSTTPPMKLLFVEMGVGYDQHGQDITAAAMRACRDAISSNSIPAFRRGSIPGVTFGEMKLEIKLGVPQSLQQSLDIEKVKSVFPYEHLQTIILGRIIERFRHLIYCSGKILNVEVVDGGLICSSGVHVEEMGDKNDDCYIVNAAVYVGY